MMKPILRMMDFSNMARISSETRGITNATRNQSKFHHGHEFRLLSVGSVKTPQGVRLFPLAARVMCPGKKTGIAVLRCSSVSVLRCLRV